MLRNQKELITPEVKSEKEAWSIPVLTELNILSETKSNNSGPSLNDGGDSFNDYNS